MFVDGVLTKHFGHDNVIEVTSKLRLSLPEGTHRVKIVFPNLFDAHICFLALDDGASCTPIKKQLKLLCMGDSITQGYDARHPSCSYANLLADHLGAEMLNQGVGGEIFFPELIDKELGYTPDVVTVAYGTNDWNRKTKENTEDRARRFYENLCAAFPRARLLAITPIWRADGTEPREFGPFEDACTVAREAAQRAGATVVDGLTLVPHTRESFADKRLHPNDDAFLLYAEKLLSHIKPLLEE